MRIYSRLALFPMALAIGFAADTKPLAIDGEPVLVVDKDNKASLVLHLRNTSGAALTLRLSSSDFKSRHTGQVLGSTAAFSAGNPANTAYFAATPSALPPDKTADVKMDVTNLWEAGESSAKLTQDGQPFGEIVAVKYHVPFALKLATPATDKEDAVFTEGLAGNISVKNDDSMTYHVKPVLTLAGRVFAGPEQNIPPGSTAVSMTLPPDAFSWAGSGTIQDDLEPARLQLRLVGGAAASDGLPGVELPVKIRLRLFPSPYQQLWNVFWVFVVLAAGASISIALNTGIPNQMKRNEVTKKLRAVTRSINALNPVVGDPFLGFVRVERSRLGDRLKGLLWFSPNLSAELPLVDQAVDLLNARLQIAQTVSDARCSVQTMLVPPSQFDGLSAAAGAIMGTAMRPDLSTTDLPTLAAAVGAFQQQIASLGQTDPNLEAKLIPLEGLLKARIDRSRDAAAPGGALGALQATSEWAPFLPQLGGLFDSLSSAPAALEPSQYFERDIASQYGDICARYLDNKALIRDAALIAKLDTTVAAEMKTLFQQRTYANLTRAKVLLETAQQGILDDQLIAALKAAPPKAEARAYPSRPDVFEPVWFEARFSDPALNTAAARERITCEWVFGKARQQGWRVSHYFTVAGEANVHAEFKDIGQSSIQTNDKPVEVSVAVNVRKHTRIGHISLMLLRTGLALFVALVALIAGVQDKIATLSLVPALLAIFVIGLTTDTIKNLLSK